MHLQWRSVDAALTLVSAHIVAKLVILWPPAPWPPAPARLGVPFNIFLSSLPRIQLLLLLRLLLPRLLLLRLLVVVVTRPGTLQSGTHQSVIP